MRVGIRFGLTVAAILGVLQLVGSGVWGLALLLGILAILSLAHGVVARGRARLVCLSYGLIVNAFSAALLALVLVFKDTLPLPWLLSLGTGVGVGLLVGAWLISRQERESPATWAELEKELERASLVDLLLARPLTTVRSEP
jgi:hypothetical protein